MKHQNLNFCEKKFNSNLTAVLECYCDSSMYYDHIITGKKFQIDAEF